MTRIERSVEIDAAPERVFHELETWDGLRRWSTITVDHTGPGSCSQVGETFQQTIRVAGLDLRTDWEVTEYDPPNLIAYRATGPGDSHMEMRQTVAATATGSRLELRIDYDLPGGALGDVVDRVYAQRRNQREADHTLANLKDLLDDRPS
jgi:uncharacterized protein YndB with AHSA1/START domain